MTNDYRSFVIVDGVLHSEYVDMTGNDFLDLPEDCYVYFPKAAGFKWFRKDITPRAENDVPKEARALALLLRP